MNVHIGFICIPNRHMSTSTDTTMLLGIRFGSGVKLVIPIWLDLVAVGVAVAVGMTAGVFPVRRAIKMSAIDAIRLV